jgi:hypothetical protein
LRFSATGGTQEKKDSGWTVASRKTHPESLYVRRNPVNCHLLADNNFIDFVSHLLKRVGLHSVRIHPGLM